MKYYTYIYFDPSRNYEPIYVGKGSGNRSKYHTKANKKHPFIQRLQHMKSIGVKPQIEIIWAADEECAFQMEIDFIAFFGRKDLGKGTLLNLTNGGGRNAGGKLSEEHKQKIREKHIGKTLSKATKEKVSESVKASIASKPKRVWDDATKEKISTSLKGHSFSEETRAKLREAQRKRRERERLTAEADSAKL